MLTDPKAYTVQLEAYRQWIGASAMLISKHLNESVPVDVIEKRALNIVEFEIELAKVLHANLSNNIEQICSPHFCLIYTHY